MARTPTDPTKAQVWVTKGLDDLDFEFYFPQGPKGDPGGWTTGTQLFANNLNTITINGLYRQDNSANATLINNYPVAAPGVMQVMERVTGSIVQVYYTITGTPTYEARVHYVRVLQASVWSPWRAFNSTRVDQTAGRAIYQWDDLNNRDQLIYGDTGFRNLDLSASAFATVDGSSTFARVRRTGQLVTVTFRLTITAANSAGSNILSAQLPTGYRAAINTTGPALMESSTMFPVPAQMSAAGDVRVWWTNTTGTLSYSVTYPTNDAWPTTLPGTAVGTIPNT